MSEIHLPESFSPRDIVGVIFRHQAAVIICFTVIVLGVSAYCFFWPPTYEATVRLMVKNDRLEPIITADQDGVRTVGRTEVTETDLNSETAVIQSAAVLERTVRDLNLDALPTHWAIRLLTWPLEQSSAVYNSYHGKPTQSAIGRATMRLARGLIVEPQKKSAIILVRLRWSDPQAAEQILGRLAANYLAQSGAVRKAPDTQAFFRKQIEVKEAQLADLDRQISEIRPAATSASLRTERDQAATQAGEFEAEWRKARALQAQASARIAGMNLELQPLPERIVLQDRNVITAQALDTLKVRVLDLRLRRTQLLEKFQPTHREVTQLEEQLREAEAMLAKEEQRSYSESTTGRNQVADTLRQDLMLNRAELSGLKALETATAQEQQAFRASASRIDGQAEKLRDLERARAAADDSYFQYVRRSEEARINDEMHQTGFVDVSLIEPVRSGSSPVKPNIRLLIELTLGLAPIISLALAFLLDVVDHRVKNDRDLEAALGVPVISVMDRYRTMETEGALARRR